MSDEQRVNQTEEPEEVEGHMQVNANDEPTDAGEGDEVEGHMRVSTTRVDTTRVD